MTNNDMIKEMANNLERLLLLRKLVSKYAVFSPLTIRFCVNFIRKRNN